jgi:hypothetical protein
MVVRGSPPHEAAKWDGDLKCLPHRYFRSCVGHCRRSRREETPLSLLIDIDVASSVGSVRASGGDGLAGELAQPAAQAGADPPVVGEGHQVRVQRGGHACGCAVRPVPYSPVPRRRGWAPGPRRSLVWPSCRCSALGCRYGLDDDAFYGVIIRTGKPLCSARERSCFSANWRPRPAAGIRMPAHSPSAPGVLQAS